MRTSTITNTNGTVFGFVQDRVVKANCGGHAPARPHLMSRAWLAKRASMATKALKRRVADAETGIARILESYLQITGPQLCRLPVPSVRRPASVRS